MHFMQEGKNLENEIKRLFIDNFNRPKKKPMHETAIQITLEDKFDHKKTSYALRQLENQNILFSVKQKIEDVGDARFFMIKNQIMSKNQNKIKKKISRYCYWIGRYSDYNIRKMLGDHLHALVKGELRAQGFRIIDEYSKRFDGKTWPGRETLDVIAEHQNNHLKIGVEIKNMLSIIPHAEISKKIEMCKFLGIKPVFACRWIEPYGKKIRENKGFAWQFKKQLYPLGQEKFVNELRKRFNFPIEVSSELPKNSILEFQKWTENREKNIFENEDTRS